jgi:hypothetical protein
VPDFGDLGYLGLDPLTGLAKKKKPAQSGTSSMSFMPDSTASGLASGAGLLGVPQASMPGATGGGVNSPTLGFNSIASLLGDPSKMMGMIQNDPLYQQLVGNLGTQGIDDAASRDAAIRRALIQFGQIPDFSSGQFAGLPMDVLNNLVNQETRDAASKYTGLGWSTLGQINTARQRQMDDLEKAFGEGKISLGGQLSRMNASPRSGEAKYQTQKLQSEYDTTKGRGEQDYQGAQFGATNQLVNAISGYQAGYLAAEKAREEARQRAAQEAADRQAYLAWLAGQGGGGGGGGGEQAPPPPPDAPAGPPPNPYMAGGAPGPSNPIPAVPGPMGFAGSLLQLVKNVQAGGGSTFNMGGGRRF